MELIQQKEHESINVNKLTTKKDKKTTTLTIVQEFPKKKADQEKEKAPEANEMVNLNSKVAKPEHHMNYFSIGFNKATDFLWKAFGFSM